MQRTSSGPPIASTGCSWVASRVQLDTTELAAWHRAGRGPAVVLEAGLGLPGLFWSDVCDRLPADRAALRYDRAGLGDSSPGAPPRTAARQAQELADLLRRLELPAPYVLVGHSAGALVIRLLAAELPGQVAAMVLVDPAAEDQRTHRTLDRAANATLAALGLLARAPRLQRAVGAGAAAAAPRVGARLARRLRLLPVVFRPAHLQATRSENQAFEQSLTQVRHAARTTARTAAVGPPVAVITAASAWSRLRCWAGQRPGRGRSGVDAAAGNGERRPILAEGSGHLVPLDDPQLVACVIERSRR
jgi:pimeloyl-ACP methyl ester carboxylesterase